MSPFLPASTSPAGHDHQIGETFVYQTYLRKVISHSCRRKTASTRSWLLRPGLAAIRRRIARYYYRCVEMAEHAAVVALA